MLLHAVTIGCGDVLPTTLAEARENRGAEAAEPSHELRIIVDENDVPLRIQMVRTRVGNRRLAPAAPARTERLVRQSAKRQEILAQLPANRRGLEVVFYRSERSVKSVGSDAAQALALDGLVTTANLEDPIYPEAWNDPLTEEQAAPLIDAEVASVEAMTNQYLADNPEPMYGPGESPFSLVVPDNVLHSFMPDRTFGMLEEGEGCPANTYSYRRNVSLGRIALIAAAAVALIALTGPFTPAVVGAAPIIVPTMAAIAKAGATAAISVGAAGTALTMMSNDLRKCERGEIS